MAGANDEPEVKDVDVVNIEPAGKDEEDVEADDTDLESSPENDGEEPDEDDESDEGEDKPDALSQRKNPPAAAAGNTPAAGSDGEDDDDLAEVPGETPRERAMRIELTKQRRENRKLRGDDLGLGRKAPASSAKKELDPEKAAVLGKYKPEDIQALKEVLPVLAEEMGYVRQEDINGNSYAEKAQESLDSFLDKHPEYTPEKDPDGTLWNAFKAEYALYKQPANPKEFTKIFERVHRDVFGIRPKGDLKTVNAGKEKVKVASHAGAGSTPPAPRSQRTVAPQGLRMDMLKGFSDEEKAELMGEE